MNFNHMPQQIEVSLLNMGIPDVTKWFFKEACDKLYNYLGETGFKKSIHLSAKDHDKYLPTHWTLGNIDTISFTDKLYIDGKNYGTHIPCIKGEKGKEGKEGEDYIISDHFGVYASITPTKPV